LAGERVEGEIAIAGVAESVANAVVDPAVKLKTKVVGNGGDSGNTAGRSVGRGIAGDCIGKEPAALGGEEVARTQRADDVGDLDVEEVYAEAQAFDGRDFEHGARILHFALFGL